MLVFSKEKFIEDCKIKGGLETDDTQEALKGWALDIDGLEVTGNNIEGYRCGWYFIDKEWIIEKE
jgi:hypothetical protein